MKNKKFLSGALAAALALSLTTPALAAGAWDDPANPVDRVYDNYDNVGKNEWDANHDTIISVFETTVDVSQLSFEVPLYVTMAVVKDKEEVVTPDNYRIYNTSKKADGNNADFSIGITGVSFTKLPGSKYETTGSTAPTANNEKQIRLSIGGVWMPALTAAGTATVDLTNAANYDGTVNTPLYDLAAAGGAKPTKIEPGKFLALPIIGTVAAMNRTAGDAAAQFKVTYVVSALDAQGNPIGNTYAGNNSDLNHAGLGDWDDATHTWTKP